MSGDLFDKPVAQGGMAISRYKASGLLAVAIVVCLLIFPQRAARSTATKPLTGWTSWWGRLSVAGFQGQESGPGIGTWFSKQFRMPRQVVRGLVTEQIVDLSTESIHLLLQFGDGAFKLGDAVFLTGVVARIA